MGTLIDYVLNIGGQSFSEKAFNNVDNLVLSLLSYVEFEGHGAIPGRKQRSCLLL